MKMIGHQNEFVKKIGFVAMCKEHFEKKSCPRFGTKEGAPFPSVGRKEVRLRVIRSVFASRLQNLPSAAKAAILLPRWRHG